jgi:DNA-binding beta-propeller fold protein YncE
MTTRPLKQYPLWLTLALLIVGCRPPATAPVATRPLPTATTPALATIVTNLRGPMAVDSEAGRLYLGCDVEGEPRIVVLDAADGRFLTAYPIGPFALDPVHGRLYVDNGDEGITVFDSQTGATLSRIELPPHQQPVYAAPIADPATGHLLAFRDYTVYVIESSTNTILDTISVEVLEQYLELGQNGPQPISEAFYDPIQQTLYLFFLTFVSGAGGYFYHTMVSYDMSRHQEIDRYGDDDTEVLPLFDAAIYEGFLYVSEDHKSGVAFGEQQHSVWSLGRRLFTAQGRFSMFVGGHFVVDSKRELIYELAEGNIRAYEPGTFDLLWVQPLPLPRSLESWHLLGYDPGTEQLYSVVDGALTRWHTSTIQPPQPVPIAASEIPNLPVDSVVVSPNWPADKTLMAMLGAWVYPPSDICGYIYLELWSHFYLSTDGGLSWGQPTGGLEANCMEVGNLFFSHNGDVLFAHITGKGLFRSVDRGQLWQPTDMNYPPARPVDIVWPGSNILYQLLESNHSLGDLEGEFLYSPPDSLYRSNDGETNWVRVLQDKGLTLAQVENFQEIAFIITRPSPLLPNISRNEGSLYRSVDNGLTWELLVLPDNAAPTALAISPDFANDHLIFIGTADGQILLLDGLTLPAAIPSP